MFHSWNQAFRIIGFLGWCPNINPAWCREQHEGWLIWPYYVFPIIRWPGFVIITPIFHLLALFSVIRGSVIAALPWMLDLWSSRQTVFVERSSRWMSSSALTFAAVLLWFIDTILFSVRWSLSLNFRFWSLFLLADDVLPWCVCMSP